MNVPCLGETAGQQSIELVMQTRNVDPEEMLGPESCHRCGEIGSVDERKENRWVISLAARPLERNEAGRLDVALLSPHGHRSMLKRERYRLRTGMPVGEARVARSEINRERRAALRIADGALQRIEDEDAPL